MLCYTVVLSVSSDEACDKQLAIQSSTGLCHTATADTHYHRSVSAPSSAPWRTRYLTTNRQTDIRRRRFHTMWVGRAWWSPTVCPS